LRLVVFGLTISSSWGNGHATTYRALLKAFAARGHEVIFFERDETWYADNRDLPDPDFCRLVLYDSVNNLTRFRSTLERADAIVIGSFVRDGVGITTELCTRREGVIAFYDIDTPVTMAKLAQGECTYLTPELIPEFDLYLSFTGGPFLRRIEKLYGAKRAVPLYCSVDEKLYRPVASKKRWELSYIGTYSPDRQPTLTRLLIEAARQRPDLAFAVAGPQYPEDIAWPHNVERLEHVSPEDHPAFYAASRFTLNVTRRDMIEAGFSPSVRLFEAGACGCPVLSDHWSGLDTLFKPGGEIIVCHKTEDTLAALEMADTARRRVAGAAHQRVLAGHTGAHRAGELEDYLTCVQAKHRVARLPAEIGESVA
jgi:spore maturation protein CgeB